MKLLAAIVFGALFVCNSHALRAPVVDQMPGPEEIEEIESLLEDANEQDGVDCFAIDEYKTLFERTKSLDIKIRQNKDIQEGELDELIDEYNKNIEKLKSTKVYKKWQRYKSKQGKNRVIEDNSQIDNNENVFNATRLSPGKPGKTKPVKKGDMEIISIPPGKQSADSSLGIPIEQGQ